MLQIQDLVKVYPGPVAALQGVTLDHVVPCSSVCTVPNSLQLREEEDDNFTKCQVGDDWLLVNDDFFTVVDAISVKVVIHK